MSANGALHYFYLSVHAPYGAGLQSKCTPGTDNEVINIVTHLRMHTF